MLIFDKGVHTPLKTLRQGWSKTYRQILCNKNKIVNVHRGKGKYEKRTMHLKTPLQIDFMSLLQMTTASTV